MLFDMKKWSLIICLTVFSLTAYGQNTYGRFIVNGEIHKLDNQSLREFANWANQHEPKYRGYFGDVADAIRNGKDVTIDTYRQTCNIMPSNLNQRQLEKLRNQPRAFESAKIKNARHAIALLVNMNWIKRTP